MRHAWMVLTIIVATTAAACLNGDWESVETPDTAAPNYGSGIIPAWVELYTENLRARKYLWYEGSDCPGENYDPFGRVYEITSGPHKGKVEAFTSSKGYICMAERFNLERVGNTHLHELAHAILQSGGDTSHGHTDRFDRVEQNLLQTRKLLEQMGVREPKQARCEEEGLKARRPAWCAEILRLREEQREMYPQSLVAPIEAEPTAIPKETELVNVIFDGIITLYVHPIAFSRIFCEEYPTPDCEDPDWRTHRPYEGSGDEYMRPGLHQKVWYHGTTLILIPERDVVAPHESYTLYVKAEKECYIKLRRGSWHGTSVESLRFRLGPTSDKCPEWKHGEERRVVIGEVEEHEVRVSYPTWTAPTPAVENPTPLPTWPSVTHSDQRKNLSITSSEWEVSRGTGEYCELLHWFEHDDMPKIADLNGETWAIEGIFGSWSARSSGKERMEYYFLMWEAGARDPPDFTGYVVFALVDYGGPVAQGTVEGSATGAGSGAAWQGQIRLSLPNERTYKAFSVGETYDHGSIDFGQCGETTHFMIWKAQNGG